MEFNVQETAGDRITVIARPLTLPGCCAICGYSGTNAGDPGDVRVFIDWQLDLEYYGRVYICSTCLLQASESLGWLGVKQAEELREKVASQESELIVLREQNERLRASLASLLGQSDNPDISVLVSDAEDLRQGNHTSEGEQLALDESSSEQEPVRVSGDSDGNFDSTGTFSL